MQGSTTVGISQGLLEERWRRAALPVRPPLKARLTSALSCPLLPLSGGCSNEPFSNAICPALGDGQPPAKPSQASRTAFDGPTQAVLQRSCRTAAWTRPVGTPDARSVGLSRNPDGGAGRDSTGKNPGMLPKRTIRLPRGGRLAGEGGDRYMPAAGRGRPGEHAEARPPAARHSDSDVPACTRMRTRRLKAEDVCGRPGPPPLRNGANTATLSFRAGVRRPRGQPGWQAGLLRPVSGCSSDSSERPLCDLGLRRRRRRAPVRRGSFEESQHKMRSQQCAVSGAPKPPQRGRPESWSPRSRRIHAISRPRSVSYAITGC